MESLYNLTTLTPIETETPPDFIGFADEPDFQLSILRANIPLILDEKAYYPLIAEFPASPGIDLIYISKDGTLLLAEMKHTTYKHQHAQAQIVFHSEHYANQTLKDILAYGHEHPHEANEDNLLLLSEFIKSSSLNLESTLGDLLREKRCSLCSTFFGKVSCRPQDQIYVPLIGIKFSSNYLYQDYIAVNVTRNKKNWEALKESYREYLSQSRNGQRTSWDKKQLEQLIENNESLHHRQIYKAVQSSKYQLRCGTAKSWSCSFLFECSNGKSIAIMNLNQNQLQIPGNLYYQMGSIPNAKQDIDELTQFISSSLPESCISFTKGKAIKVSLLSHDITSAHIDKLMASISAFTAKHSD